MADQKITDLVEMIEAPEIIELTEERVRLNGQNQEEQPKERRRNQFNKWNEEGMEAAINQYKQEMESGKQPKLNLLAKTWNIPRSTLQRRVKGLVHESHNTAGRKALLPPEAEKDLANTLISLSEQGVPLRPSNIQAVAFNYAKENGIPGFSEEKEKAGFCWFKGFLKRNPNLSSRISKGLLNFNSNCPLETTEIVDEETIGVDKEIEYSNEQSQERQQKARKQLKTWSEENMEAAICQYQKELDSGRQPKLRPIAKTWNVPRTTLQRRVKEVTSALHYPAGSKALLSPEAEKDNHKITDKTYELYEEIKGETGHGQEEQPNARKRKLNTWSEEKMEAAINQYQQELESGKEPSVCLLARYWNVPKLTLQRRVKGVVHGFRNAAAGRKVFFPPEAEQDLANSLVSLAEQGFSLTPNEVRIMAFQYARENGIPGFSEDKEKAGFYWFKGFMKRNPNLSSMLSKCPFSGDGNSVETTEMMEQKTEVHENVESESGQSEEEQTKAMYWQELESGNEANLCPLELPRTTLQMDGVFPGFPLTAGRKALLPPEAEDALANTLILMAEQGLPQTPSDVQILAFNYAKANGIPGFSEAKGKAGAQWLKGFLKRNPNVCLRMSEDLSDGNNNCPLETIEMGEQEIADFTEEMEIKNEHGQDDQPKSIKRKQFNNWSEERMEAAINQYQLELESGIKTKVRRLAKIWKVPRSTLQRRLKGGVRHAAGRKALLPPEAEKDLAETLMSLSEEGVPLKPTVVRSMAFQYAKANGFPGFSDTKETAGYYWFKGFIKRNPNVCLKMSEGLSDVNRSNPLETTEKVEQKITEVSDETENNDGQNQNEQPKARKTQQFHKWSEERMESAINHYQQELDSGRQPKLRLLAKTWGVPRSTLQRRVKGVVRGFQHAAGRKALLPPEAEKDLANTLVSLSKQGFPPTPTDIRTLAFHYAKANGIPVFSETKEKAGFDWFKGFMKRNPNVCQMSADSSDINRSSPIETTEMVEQKTTEIKSLNEHGQDEQLKAKKSKELNRWNEERMKAAINQYQQELDSGTQPKLRRLAKIWNVPRSTLQRRVKGVLSGFQHAAGSKALLPPDAEQDLANTLISLPDQGFSLKPPDIQTLAFQYAKANGIPGFSEAKEKAGFHWLKDFMKPEIHTGMSGSSEVSLQNYEALLAILGITELPSHIWCCDEVSLQDNFSYHENVAEVGQSCEEMAEKATILAGFNAVGTFAPTVFIFKARTFEDSWLYGSNDNILARASEDGLINAEVLSEWGNAFVSHLPKDNFPHLLLLNAPCSQLFNEELLNYLKEHNVYVMSCPLQISQQSHAVHQVLFRSLQENWSIAAQEWSRDTFGMKMSNVIFFSLFLEAWKKSFTVENAQSGFRDSGMYPIMKSKPISVDEDEVEGPHNQQE